MEDEEECNIRIGDEKGKEIPCFGADGASRP